MNEAICGFLGTIIGGVCVIIATQLNIRSLFKIESQRFLLMQLNEKKQLIEKLFNNCSFDYSDNIEIDQYTIIDDYKIVSDFLRTKWHYFLYSGNYEKIEKILVYIKQEKTIDTQISLYEELDINNKVNELMKSELKKTMNKISDITNRKQRFAKIFKNK